MPPGYFPPRRAPAAGAAAIGGFLFAATRVCGFRSEVDIVEPPSSRGVQDSALDASFLDAEADLAPGADLAAVDGPLLPVD